ncbi:MAG: class I SAM-dependent methyltransferase [Thermoleophilia bacterium]|nr:class I SAM-dependent methyltransferase [Thermoleophilia bacterium]
MSPEERQAKLILEHVDHEEETYSDGQDIEEEITRIVSSEEKAEAIKNKLEADPSWAVLAHLSPERENLLSWYPFRKDASLLEAGAGFGALTGLFCRRVKKVTAIELTGKRAEATAARHGEFANLTVIAGSLARISLKEKFDYVAAIGVLEYAGRYEESSDPFLGFLKTLRSSLAEGGTLILAIENRFGLKYWAGAREDHTGRLAESIEGYPHQKATQTFSKGEIRDLLENAGFKRMEFYYPLPDYKFALEIFSDSYLPTINHNVRTGIYPYPDLCRPREFFFDEKLVNDSLVKEGKFGFFANSFLIFARAKQ